MVEGWKEGEKGELGGPFKIGLKRRLDVWDFEMNLSEVCKTEIVWEVVLTFTRST
jgi:hypothetical protein